MKRYSNPFNIILVVIMFFLIVTPAFAGGIIDTVKGWGGSIGWEVIAGVLTALLAIGGMAKKAKWFSGVLLVMQTLFACFATFFETIGSVFGWAGSALQDGKLSAEEMKKAPGIIKEAFLSIKQTWGTVSTAWGSLKNG